jgi:hypothetical protein
MTIYGYIITWFKFIQAAGLSMRTDGDIHYMMHHRKTYTKHCTCCNMIWLSLQKRSFGVCFPVRLEIEISVESVLDHIIIPDLPDSITALYCCCITDTNPA